MPWSSNITPLNPALSGVSAWVKSTEPGFKAGFKKHVLSRVVTPIAIVALGSVSFVYNAGSFALKTPVTLMKYTFLMVIPVKVNGKWCALGSCVPSTFGAKEMCKHGLKAVAFLVEVVACPVLGVVSPTFVIWLNVKASLVKISPPKEKPADEDLKSSKPADLPPTSGVLQPGDELSRRLAEEATKRSGNLHHHDETVVNTPPISAETSAPEPAPEVSAEQPISQAETANTDSSPEQPTVSAPEQPAVGEDVADLRPPEADAAELGSNDVEARDVEVVDESSDDVVVVEDTTSVASNEEPAVATQDELETEAQYQRNLAALRAPLLQKRNSIIGILPESINEQEAPSASGEGRTKRPSARHRFLLKKGVIPDNKELLKKCNRFKGKVKDGFLDSIRNFNKKDLKHKDKTSGDPEGDAKPACSLIKAVNRFSRLFEARTPPAADPSVPTEDPSEAEWD